MHPPCALTNVSFCAPPPLHCRVAAFMMTFLGNTLCVCVLAVTLSAYNIVSAQHRTGKASSVRRVLVAGPVVCLSWAVLWYVHLGPPCLRRALLLRLTSSVIFLAGLP